MTTELSPRERVMRLFNGEKIDRIPLFSGMGNVTVYGLEEYGWRFPEIHLDAHKMAKMAASSYKLFGFECAVVPFDMGVEAEALGCKVNYYEDATDILYPTISGKLADKLEDLDIKLSPDLEKAGRIPVVTEAIHLLKEEIGEKVAVGAWVLGPFTLAGQIVKLKDVYKMTIRQPEIVDQALDILDEIVISIANIYKRSGADYLVIREMGAGESTLNPNIFASMITPHLKRIFAAVGSPKVLHICGETNTIIEDMARCGAEAVSVDQKNRLAESRKKLGDSTILLGNIDPYNTLVEGKPEDVEEAVKIAIATGADGIWPGCDIWPKVSKENMEALVAATRKYGSRP